MWGTNWLHEVLSQALEAQDYQYSNKNVGYTPLICMHAWTCNVTTTYRKVTQGTFKVVQGTYWLCYEIMFNPAVGIYAYTVQYQTMFTVGYPKISPRQCLSKGQYDLILALFPIHLFTSLWVLFHVSGVCQQNSLLSTFIFYFGLIKVSAIAWEWLR